MKTRSASSFQTFQQFPVKARSASSFESFIAKITRSISSYSVLEAIQTRSASSFEAIGAKRAMSPSAYRSFTQENRVIYATNIETGLVTNLGTLISPSTTLIDVPLADGSYRIEVRSSLNYWQEARSRVTFPIKILAGVVEFVDIPEIVDLRVTINELGKTLLNWSIPDIGDTSGLTFGIWESAISPVDVSGVPDYTIDVFDGVGNYKRQVDQQIGDLFYAVATFDAIDQGIESEVFSDWNTIPPITPPNQNIYS